MREAACVIRGKSPDSDAPGPGAAAPLSNKIAVTIRDRKPLARAACPCHIPVAARGGPLQQESVMTDTTTATNGKKRKAIAERDWINADGDVVSTGAPDVAGIRYTYLATGNSVEYLLGQNEQLDRQFAAMGAVTKIGNVVNTFKDDGESGDPIDAVKEWLKAAMAGEWREAGEAVARGPKYDKDILAAVIVQVLGDKAGGDLASYRLRLDDKSYYAKVRAKTKIMAAYHAELAKRGTPDESNVDDLA